MATMPNVVLLPRLNAQFIANLLEEASIGLAPYKRNAPQGLPNKFFEYLAYGVFQIITLDGEAKTLLETTNTGASCHSADEFKKLIIKKSFRTHLQKNEIKKTFKDNFDADRSYGTSGELRDFRVI